MRVHVQLVMVHWHEGYLSFVQSVSVLAFLWQLPGFLSRLRACRKARVVTANCLDLCYSTRSFLRLGLWLQIIAMGHMRQDISFLHCTRSLTLKNPTVSRARASNRTFTRITKGVL